MADKSAPHLDDLYREVILDHYREPCGRDPIANATHKAEGFNPVCGDECQVELHVTGKENADGVDTVKSGALDGVHVGGRGCSISVASGSILAQLVKGKDIALVRRMVAAFRGMMHGDEPPTDLDLGDLEVLAGIKDFPVRVKCAMLAWTTLETALAGGCGKATTEHTVDDVLPGNG